MDQIFLTVHQWLAAGGPWAGAGAFAWGVVSVLFSPCHLASIPLIIAYVGGQNELVSGKRAAFYALAFTTGLFTTIAAVGAACAVLGRMLGDLGPWWMVAVGALLLLVALDMLGIVKTKMGSGLPSRLSLRGVWGALVLGLCYGLLTGTCTFGFIAPILAVITIQNKVGTGLAMIVLFALGHCLPIAAAGSSSALAKRLLENSAWQSGSRWFKKAAGVLIAALGLYFMAQPFVSA